MQAFDLNVPIDRDPDGVGGWWLDFPGVYEAADPHEQPYRIETVSRTPDRIQVWTYWRVMGMKQRWRETITVIGPRAFDAHITMGSVEVYDRFRIADDGRGGTVVHIHSEMSPTGTMGRLKMIFMAGYMHRWMVRIWAHAARICAEDGRRNPRL